MSDILKCYCGGAVKYDRARDALVCQSCGYSVPIVPKTKADKAIAAKCGFTMLRPVDEPEVIEGNWVTRSLGRGK